jgi:hypothetical protein
MKNAATAAAFVALASCLNVTSRAASPAPVPENLLACSRLQDDGERVRCYDREIKTMSAAYAASTAPTPTTRPPLASTPAAVTAPAAAAAAAPKATAPAAAASGASAASAASASGAPSTHFGEELLPPTSRPAPTVQETTLHSSISAMKEVRPKVFIISLANGQVWRQEGTQITMFFHVGDDVRIEKHTLGSYHMSTAATGEKNWVRVTRIQ